jgi:hypothetical protein
MYFEDHLKRREPFSYIWQDAYCAIKGPGWQRTTPTLDELRNRWLGSVDKLGVDFTKGFPKGNL